LVATPLGDGFVLVDDADLLDSQPPFVGVIVPEQRARGFYFDDHGRATSYWTPEVAHVLAVAKALRARRWKQHPRIGIRLVEYRYHVVGVEIDGKRLLYVNAFCTPESDWQRKSVVVDDGGDCYFQLSYDPAVKAILKLTVNGEG
jgi:hypothetical protein